MKLFSTLLLSKSFFVLLQISAAMNEGKVVRKYAIRLLRNLLVKHEFDDRYQIEVCIAKIAPLLVIDLSLIIFWMPEIASYSLN